MNDIEKIKSKIKSALPEGMVIPDHDQKGHWYRVNIPTNPRYPSVTGKIKVIKDQSLMNYKMNQALDYMFRHYKDLTDENIMDHLDKAGKAAIEVRDDAGDIGSQVHDIRQVYYTEYIRTGKRPSNILDFVSEVVKGKADPRVISGARAVEKFTIDYDWVPIVTELMVYDEELQVGGMLDDIGLMRYIKRQGREGCQHELIQKTHRYGITNCVKCDLKYTYELDLMDLKTSNRLKEHYWFQVALYYYMFYKLTGLKPKNVFILKVSKENGTYDPPEYLTKISRVVQYAKWMIKTNEGLEFIKTARKKESIVI